MLACLSESSSNGLTSSGGQSMNNQITIDKLVNECLKLKKRNKEMKLTILSFEAREKECVEAHEKQLKAVKIASDNEISSLKAEHFIELTQLRDYRIQDITDLTRQLHNSQKNLMNQNPLIVTMSDKIKSLERALDKTKQTYEEQIEKLKVEVSVNKTTKSPESKFNVEKQNLLNRALAAENELRQFQLDTATKIKHLEDQVFELESKNCKLLKSPTKSSSRGVAVAFTEASGDNNVTELQLKIDNLKAEVISKQDEIEYYRQENIRLEKQVALIKEELSQCSNGHKFSNNSNSENKQCSKTIIDSVPLSINTTTTADDKTGIASLSSPTINKVLKPINNTKLVTNNSDGSSVSTVLPTPSRINSKNTYVDNLNLVDGSDGFKNSGSSNEGSMATKNNEIISTKVNLETINERATQEKISGNLL